MTKKDFGYFIGVFGIIIANYCLDVGWAGIGFIFIWIGIYYLFA